MPNITVGDFQIEWEQRGAGRDLVLLPTLLAEMSVYDAVIDALAAKRRVTRLNFPGFGGSTGPIGDAVEDYADLIAATLRALDLTAETDLIGNGFGGFIAGTLAIHHGSLIDKLVLVDTGAGFPDPAKEPLRILAQKSSTEGMDAVLDAAILRMFPEDFIATAPDIIATRKQQLSKADPLLFANAALALTLLDNRPKLGEIKNQTLVVVGLADATTPPELSRELHAGIDGSQLIELPGIGHCPQLQDPAGFLVAIGPFLEVD
jgi:3-oxoadipate enol-lactonase